MRKRYMRTGVSLSVGFILLIITFGVILGGMSIDYILSCFGKDIPMLVDCVIGLLTSPVSIPTAIVGWILKMFSVF